MANRATVGDLVAWWDRVAPRGLQASWDYTGLQLGQPEAVLRRLGVAVTVTTDVVAWAVAHRCDALITHHPILFRGAKSLAETTPEGRLLRPLLQHDIAVFSPHTRWDDAPGGINDDLATLLGLTELRPLRPLPPWTSYKLVVFTPHDATSRVLAALFDAGAGKIQNYTECSFRHAGTGTFFGQEGTNPVVGQRGRREEVAEERIEVVMPAERRTSILRALHRAHPYEVPAYDVYPVVDWPPGGQGRFGVFPEPCSLAQVIARLAPLVDSLSQIQYVGSLDQPIRSAAVACGAAAEFLGDALQQGADLFLLGECKYHEALQAREAGLALVLPGHWASERWTMTRLPARLQPSFPEVEIVVIPETDPFRRSS